MNNIVTTYTNGTTTIHRDEAFPGFPDQFEPIETPYQGCTEIKPVILANCFFTSFPNEKPGLKDLYDINASIVETKESRQSAASIRTSAISLLAELFRN